jgi:ABC-type hemin transport system substrate-binding protein
MADLADLAEARAARKLIALIGSAKSELAEIEERLRAHLAEPVARQAPDVICLGTRADERLGRRQ